MSAPDLSVSLKPNTLVRCKARPLVFEKKSPSSLPVIPSLSLPVRVAIVGNHLPRQCGIATFTTDLCDAIAVEYGAAGVLVAAVNDPQSRYSYPARVRFELTEGDLSSYQAAADFLNSSNVGCVFAARVWDFWREGRQPYLATAAAPQNASGDNSAYGSS